MRGCKWSIRLGTELAQMGVAGFLIGWVVLFWASSHVQAQGLMYSGAEFESAFEADSEEATAETNFAFADETETVAIYQETCGEFEIARARGLGRSMWQHALAIDRFSTAMTKEYFDTFPADFELENEFVLDMKAEFLNKKLDEFYSMIETAGVLQTFAEEAHDDFVPYFVSVDLIGDYKTVRNTCPLLAIDDSSHTTMDIEFAADMASASAAGAESCFLNQLAYVRMLQTPPIPQECLDRRSQLEAIKAELQELLAEVESNANPAIAAQQMQRFIDSNERFQTAVLNYKTTDCDLSLVLDVIDDYRRLHNQINWLLHDGENRQDPIDMPNETYL